MRVPCATYRLQFNHLFGFNDALSIVGYLEELGISDIYSSPIFNARSGSLHGYDVVDQNEINPELGPEEDFYKLSSEFKKRGMGWLQDVVSNHMAYDSNNTMLMDVLEKGANSRFAGFFDIEWDHPYEGIQDRVLAPFLGRFYGEALESGEIKLMYDNMGFFAHYFSFRFPLKIDSYVNILSHDIKRLKNKLGRDNPDFIKLLGILYVLKNLPSASELNELYDQVIFIKRILWELYARNSDIKEYLDENISLFNGKAGDPESFNMLDRLLSEQFFKFSFWKVAAEEINYRRFFNINELITLKIEQKDVFSHIHALLLRLIKDGHITGVRIDHIDGFYNPLNYLKRLKEKTGDIYIAVEKILGYGEELPTQWPVEGSTGYDFLNMVNGVFCDRRKENRFTRTYTGFTRLRSHYYELFYEKKKLITEMDMTSDVSNLAQLLKFTLSKDRYGSDITLPGLKRAIIEVMAFFPVYRTYISPESFTLIDIRHIKDAVKKAVKRNPALLNELKFIEKVLMLEYKDYMTEEEKKEWLHFVMRFQQFTGPLMAKGIEDTLFYVYNRLLSLNEVGGEPGRFGETIEALHAFNKKRAEISPFSMSASSTHDTKRGEDARARLNVLSELSDEWEENIKKWHTINKKKKRLSNGINVPDKNDEYFLYQTLIAAFPFYDEDYASFVERIKAYIVKAVREAKIHTAWLKPDSEYEETYLNFINRMLEKKEGNEFLREFLPFQKKVAWYGMLNSLSQTLIKMTAPGIPDFYQGTEVWDLNLVDPDNRRPVDFGKRGALLKDIKNKAAEDLSGFLTDILRSPEDGRIKLYLIHTALKERKRLPELFTKGQYFALEAKGPFKEHLIAFARKNGNSIAISIAPRLTASFVKTGEYPFGQGAWGETEIILPFDFLGFNLKEVFTGTPFEAAKSLQLSDVLKSFPTALLIGEKRS
ncbi:MAG: malto-oligosyltrehalose synthase [Deltaproteobacteria bacterium]|nr:malto-oligosyltrehalose synthase [Deltaproteobacteria bacterium]